MSKKVKTATRLILLAVLLTLSAALWYQNEVNNFNVLQTTWTFNDKLGPWDGDLEKISMVFTDCTTPVVRDNDPGYHKPLDAINWHEAGQSKNPEGGSIDNPIENSFETRGYCYAQVYVPFKSRNICEVNERSNPPFGDFFYPSGTKEDGPCNNLDIDFNMTNGLHFPQKSLKWEIVGSDWGNYFIKIYYPS